MRKLAHTAAEDLRELSMRRYERASMLLTSNRPVDDWGTLLGDTAAVTALLDRLMHHAHVVKCEPRSWRAKVTRIAVWGKREIELYRPRSRSPEMTGFEMSTNGRLCTVHRGSDAAHRIAKVSHVRASKQLRDDAVVVREDLRFSAVRAGAQLRSLVLEGDTQPTDAEVEQIGREQGVSLVPADDEPYKYPRARFAATATISPFTPRRSDQERKTEWCYEQIILNLGGEDWRNG